MPLIGKKGFALSLPTKKEGVFPGGRDVNPGLRGGVLLLARELRSFSGRDALFLKAVRGSTRTRCHIKGKRRDRVIFSSRPSGRRGRGEGVLLPRRGERKARRKRRCSHSVKVRKTKLFVTEGKRGVLPSLEERLS